MSQIGEIQYVISGDTGGRGVSRFRFVRQDSAAITGTDCNAAASAAHGLLAALSGDLPSDITWVCNPQVNIYDWATGLVQGPLTVSSLPPTITGAVGGSYAAGTGLRLNWKTSTLSGRRLIKGATFVVPLGSSAYTTAGAVSSGVVSAATSAATTYLTAMTTATLYPVIWKRPKKGTFSGGVFGIATGGIGSAVPAGLRSRRS